MQAVIVVLAALMVLLSATLLLLVSTHDARRRPARVVVERRVVGRAIDDAGRIRSLDGPADERPARAPPLSFHRTSPSLPPDAAQQQPPASRSCSA